MDRSSLAHLAQLSRLAIAPDSESALAAEISQILDLVDALKAAPVAGLEPLAHPLDAVSVLRADVVTESDQSEAVLALAPESNDGFYLVPKVIE